MPPKRVLIVGGGLAGPALAIGLARHGIKSTIFELRSEAGDSGGAIMLAPNALKVLDKVFGVEDHIREVGYTFENITLASEEGDVLGKVSIGDVEGTGYPAVRIKRPALHKVLLDVCERMRDSIEIRYGEKVESVKENDQGVKVKFESGLTAEGDILVGADGMHSKVRQFVLGESTPVPTFSGRVGVGSSIKLAQINLPKTITLPAFIYTRSGIFMVIPTNPAGDECGWAAQRDTKERDRQGWLDYQTSGEAARVTKADYEDCPYEPIRSIMDTIDETSLRVWAPYEIPDLSTWHKGRICLIGDAAHAIPPTGGQGAAQAFEDAGYLVRLLASDQAVAKGYDKLFAHFERVRKARIEYVRAFTKTSGDTRGSSANSLMWTLKKMAMGAYFWFKGGVAKDTRLTGYDVSEESIEVV